MAEAIGQYLMNAVDENIYPDKYDAKLRRAVSSDDEQIVESIKEGIKSLTVLLCIISDKTRWSWWVPYEVECFDPSYYGNSYVYASIKENLLQWLF